MISMSILSRDINFYKYLIKKAQINGLQERPHSTKRALITKTPQKDVPQKQAPPDDAHFSTRHYLFSHPSTPPLQQLATPRPNPLWL